MDYVVVGILGCGFRSRDLLMPGMSCRCSLGSLSSGSLLGFIQFDPELLGVLGCPLVFVLPCLCLLFLGLVAIFQLGYSSLHLTHSKLEAVSFGMDLLGLLSSLHCFLHQLLFERPVGLLELCMSCFELGQLVIDPLSGPSW